MMQKKIFHRLAVLIAGLFATMSLLPALPVQAAETTFYTSPAESTLTVGDEVTFSICVQGNTGFSSATIDMLYDPAFLTVVSADRTEATQGIALSTDTPGVVHSEFPADSELSGDGTLYSATFQAIESGTTNIAVSVDGLVINAAEGEELDVLASGSVVTIADSAHHVTFDTQGYAENPAVQDIEDGQFAVEPEKPTCDGFVFEGWFTEPECLSQYLFDVPVIGDFTLFAKWVEEGYLVELDTDEGVQQVDLYYNVNNEQPDEEDVDEAMSRNKDTGEPDKSQDDNQVLFQLQLQGDASVSDIQVYEIDENDPENQANMTLLEDVQVEPVTDILKTNLFRVTNIDKDIQLRITTDDHTHVPGEPVKENIHEATCKDPGSYDEVVYCTVPGCGAELSRETKEIPPTGEHTPAEPVKENIVDPTCGKEGSYDEVVYCSVCGDELSREKKTVPPTGEHIPDDPQEENVKEPTCEEEGSYDEVTYCSVCHQELSSEPKTIPALGHLPGEPVRENVVDPTCTEDGSYDEVVRCEREYKDKTVCGKVLSSEHVVVPAAHTPGEPVKENVVAPTCTKDGSYDWIVYCTVCGDELSSEHVVEKATGHKPGDPVDENRVEPTCTADGKVDHVVYCTVDTCKAELSRETEILEKLPHTKGRVETKHVEPTCTEEGSDTTIVHCAVCETAYDTTTTPLPAKGHSWDSGKVTKEPTCEVAGEMTYTCQNDQSHTKTEPVAALGHTWDSTGTVCERCGKLKEGASIQLIEGNGQTFDRARGGALRFKSNDAFMNFNGEKFTGKVIVDNRTLSGSEYTSQKGSIVVTLNESFMKTLTTGQHSISIISANGSANGTFNVANGVNPVDPTQPTTAGPSSITPAKTGDDSHMTLWIILGAVAVVAIGAVVGIIVIRKKRGKM